LLSHPNWVPLLSLGNQPAAMPYREHLLGQMSADAIPAQEASTALSNAGLMAVGFVLAELVYRDPNGQSALTHKLLRFRRWSRQRAERNPSAPAPAGAEQDAHFDLDAQFEALVKNYVVGLEASRSAGRGGQPLE
jgi:hypothetical protein